MSLPSHLLNKVADVYRPSLSSDGGGGMTASFALLTSDLPCRLTAASGRETRLYGADKIPSTHTIFCNVTDITKDDKLMVDGEEYNVLFVNNVDGMDHHLELACSKITPAI